MTKETHISPYLRRPLRTEAEVVRERTINEIADWLDALDRYMAGTKVSAAELARLLREKINA